jgi:hypothetical protein
VEEDKDWSKQFRFISSTISLTSTIWMRCVCFWRSEW